MQSSGKLKVGDLNPLLTCVLCNGYYIDATTVIECLHSFCKTCIVRYLQTNKYCPICEVQVHKTRPLQNIRSDQTLQDIVYKIVPDLFKNEMKRRRDFYSQQSASVNVPTSSEKRGDVLGCDRLIFTPEDIISISLEYSPPHLTFPLRMHSENGDSLVNSVSFDSFPKNETHRRYLQCPGVITVHHLKRLLQGKYNLISCQKIDIMYMHDYLRDEYTLIDLAYIYSWRRNGPLRLFYKIYEKPCKRLKKSETDVTEALQTAASESTSLPPTPSCTEMTVASPAPFVAAAPSSQSHLQRHPSPPPSPQMAVEPDYVKLGKPNSAAMLNRPQNKVIEPGIPAAGHKTNAPNAGRNPASSNLPKINVETKPLLSTRKTFRPEMKFHPSDLSRINAFNSKKGSTAAANFPTMNFFDSEKTVSSNGSPRHALTSKKKVVPEDLLKSNHFSPERNSLDFLAKRSVNLVHKPLPSERFQMTEKLLRKNTMPQNVFKSGKANGLGPGSHSQTTLLARKSS